MIELYAPFNSFILTTTEKVIQLRLSPSIGLSSWHFVKFDFHLRQRQKSISSALLTASNLQLYSKTDQNLAGAPEVTNNFL